MRITESQLRQQIRQVLQEEVFGAQAFVYHGSKLPPETFLSILQQDAFKPGTGAGSLYGKGLYTVYDINRTQTESGAYGDYIYKLKVNLHGFIIFDWNVAVKVYKKPLSVSRQAELCGYSDDIVKRLKRIKPPTDFITSEEALKASRDIKGIVKGIVFTGSNDGKVCVIYDPKVVIPIAWKNTKDKDWHLLSKEQLKNHLSDEAILGTWKSNKYEKSAFSIAKMLQQPGAENYKHQGDLDLSKTGIKTLPDGLEVTGSLKLTGTQLTRLPKRLKVGFSLEIEGTKINVLPPDLEAGSIYLDHRNKIKELPDGLKVKRSIWGFTGNMDDVPDYLKPYIKGRH